MKVIIDIPDEIYNKIHEGGFWLESGLTLSDTYDFIKNDTPLPKGHGDLIDEKEAVGLIAEGKNDDKAYFGQ